MFSTAKKVIAMALVATLSASLLGAETSALQYTGTASFQSGKYCRNLEQVKLTGDARTDIVAIARSQIGYQEGGSVNQLSGEVHGSVNFTEYGAWYGVQDMWCAMFVSWCAARAKISGDTVPSHCYTPEGLSWFAARGLAYTRAEVQSRKYTPKPGDLIYFKSSRNAKITNHVGIVTGYANNRIYTVEGNIGAPGQFTSGGMVAEMSYPISNTYIAFICSPNYESGSTNVLPDASVREQELHRQSLTDAVITLETGDEMGFDTVRVDPSGKVLLGCGQWYGAQAVQLLWQIREADANVFGTLELEPLLSSGTLPRLSEQQQEAIRGALASCAGIQVQKDRMSRELEGWMLRAEALGVTDRDSLLLCAALYQLRGCTAAEQIIAGAGDAPTKEELLCIVKDREPGLYRSCRLLVG